MNYVSLRTMARYFLAHKKKFFLLILIGISIGLAYGYFSIPAETPPPKLSETAKVQIRLNEGYKDSLTSLKSINQTFPQLATDETWETKITLFLSPDDPQRQDKLTSLYYGVNPPKKLLEGFNELAEYKYSRYQFNRLSSIKLRPDENIIVVSAYGATKDAVTFLADAILDELNKRQSTSSIPHQIILVDRVSQIFEKKETYEEAKNYFDNAQKTRRNLLYSVTEPAPIVPFNSNSRIITFGLIGLILGLTLTILISLFRSIGKAEYFSLGELKEIGYPIVGSYTDSTTRMNLNQKLLNDLANEDPTLLIDRTFLQIQRRLANSNMAVKLLAHSDINISPWLSRAKELKLQVEPIIFENIDDITIELFATEPILLLVRSKDIYPIGQRYLDLLMEKSIIAVN